MADPALPPREELIIHFAHVAYRLAERFALRDTGIGHFQTWNAEETLARAGEGHVLVLSGLMSPELLERAERLRFIQVCAAGYNNFDLDAIRARGVRMANGTGVNRNAVSDHAMSLILAIARKLPEACENQRRRHWRGMISDLSRREDELAGKTLLVYGMGAIGERLVKLAKAFDMTVIGFKRDPSRHGSVADEVHAAADLHAWLPRADYVALTCPLTDETRNVIDARALAAMRDDAWLVNVARGGCVDTAALVDALGNGAIAGAALDVTEPEPLPADSPLWEMANVLITPHTAGETRRYEDNVVDILIDNLERLWADETRLVNGII
ncbi:MAG: D-2-hydroxyacid dehydrogenase [Gammaproteobacteria bacterium]|nr:D-2-hydroxyacid dehydrogenase [Gammaproteobacteria bacterium]